MIKSIVFVDVNDFRQDDCRNCAYLFFMIYLAVLISSFESDLNG